MWDLPGSGLERVSPALAGRFLIIAPPGKLSITFLSICVVHSSKSCTFSILFNPPNLCPRIGIVMPIFIDEEKELIGSKACPKSNF